MSGASQPSAPCSAIRLVRLRLRSATEDLDDLVDRVGGHAPVRRELAAGDGDDAARRGVHRVAAREVGGALALGRGDERPQPGPRPEDVGLGDLRGRRAVDRAQQVRHVVGGDLRIVDRPVVVGVGRADVGEAVRSAVAAPRHDEHRAPILRHGDHDRDLVAHQRPRHRDVDALGGADRGGVRCVVERADVVRPHAGRVDDGAGADFDLVAVDASTRRAPLTLPAGVLREPDERRVVDDRGAVARPRSSRR